MLLISNIIFLIRQHCVCVCFTITDVWLNWAVEGERVSRARRP